MCTLSVRKTMITAVWTRAVTGVPQRQRPPWPCALRRAHRRILTSGAARADPGENFGLSLHNRKLAVLIDGENAQAAVLEALLAEVSK